MFTGLGGRAHDGRREKVTLGREGSPMSREGGEADRFRKTAYTRSPPSPTDQQRLHGFGVREASGANPRPDLRRHTWNSLDAVAHAAAIVRPRAATAGVWRSRRWDATQALQRRPRPPKSAYRALFTGHRVSSGNQMSHVPTADRDEPAVRCRQGGSSEARFQAPEGPSQHCLLFRSPPVQIFHHPTNHPSAYSTRPVCSVMPKQSTKASPKERHQPTKRVEKAAGLGGGNAKASGAVVPQAGAKAGGRSRIKTHEEERERMAVRRERDKSKSIEQSGE